MPAVHCYTRQLLLQMGVSFPAGTWLLQIPGELQVPLGFQVMTQCGVCGAGQPWGLHLPWPKTTAHLGARAAAGQGNPAFSPVAGLFRAACSELCQALFGGILAGDRRAIWHCTQTQHGVHPAGACSDGKAAALLPLP